MLGLREAGVLGASLAVAGGVAYVVWNYSTSTTSTSAGKEPQQDVTSEQPAVVPAAAPPVVAAEPKKPSEPAGTQVLVLGLDGAGKTSLLNCFSTGCLEPDVQPTEGFNAVSINREDLHIEFLEIGGKEELRPYWQKYMSRALLLVFVVDSSSPELFPIAKKHLHELLAPEPDLPLMVLANKQDLPGSCGITDLHEALSLSELGDRRLLLIDTYVKKGEAALGSGVQDARDLIIQMVCDGK
ncbi:ADP-ribosylation factor-like protein 9 [Liparis tanakae]|uniref:ADP-ribosylation factor-like protein 9 n=1 Tax=Liparis tanakae TaxID=230148 RepID=A0A4Z2HMN5_9TELE|nr:ADP-ribosylation factor-like protein 9 [Liparis tanakae]